MDIRILIQSKVRQLARAPGSIDSQSIEKDRDALTPLMTHLKQLQQTAGVNEINGTSSTENELLDIWDDIIYETVTAPTSAPISSTAPTQLSSIASGSGAAQILPSNSSNSVRVAPIPIEEQLLSLPSNGNIDSIHQELECAHRISLAEQHLNQIRNLIAEKSFQYSHLIRVAPRKAIATRSRAAVTRLNQQIAFHCRMYSKCRSRILQLGADEETLFKLRILSPSDIGASTAIVNPNEPGSSNVKLSWIWQTAGGHRFGLTSEGNIGPDLNIGPGHGAGDRLAECK